MVKVFRCLPICVIVGLCAILLTPPSWSQSGYDRTLPLAIGNQGSVEPLANGRYSVQYAKVPYSCEKDGKRLYFFGWTVKQPKGFFGDWDCCYATEQEAVAAAAKKPVWYICVDYAPEFTRFTHGFDTTSSSKATTLTGGVLIRVVSLSGKCTQSVVSTNPDEARKVPCDDPTPLPPPTSKLADVTHEGWISIGGRMIKEGGSQPVDLKYGDAFNVSRGVCAFRVKYGMVNKGGAATGSGSLFWNRLRYEFSKPGEFVTGQSELQLDAGQRLEIETDAYIDRGSHQMVLSLDHFDKVQEADEANNELRFSVQVDKACGTLASTGGAP